MQRLAPVTCDNQVCVKKMLIATISVKGFKSPTIHQKGRFTMLNQPSFNVSRLDNVSFPQSLSAIDKLSDSKRLVHYHSNDMILRLIAQF